MAGGGNSPPATSTPLVFPTRALGPERLEDIRLQSTDRPGDRPLYACGGGCDRERHIKGASAGAPIARRETKSPRLRPSHRQSYLRRSQVENDLDLRGSIHRERIRAVADHTCVRIPTHGRREIAYERLHVGAARNRAAHPRVPDSHATDTSKFSLTDSGTLGRCSLCRAAGRSNAEPNAARTAATSVAVSSSSESTPVSSSPQATTVRARAVSEPNNWWTLCACYSLGRGNDARAAPGLWGDPLAQGRSSNRKLGCVRAPGQKFLGVSDRSQHTRPRQISEECHRKLLRKANIIVPLLRRRVDRRSLVLWTGLLEVVPAVGDYFVRSRKFCWYAAGRATDLRGFQRVFWYGSLCGSLVALSIGFGLGDRGSRNTFLLDRRQRLSHGSCGDGAGARARLPMELSEAVESWVLRLTGDRKSVFEFALSRAGYTRT